MRNKFEKNYYDYKFSRASELPTYKDMVECATEGDYMDIYLVMEALQQAGHDFDLYCGNDYNEDEDTYQEVFRYFMITPQAAEFFARYTNEIIIFNEDLDLYILCVTHFGTSWDYIDATWKEKKYLGDGEYEDDELDGTYKGRRYVRRIGKMRNRRY